MGARRCGIGPGCMCRTARRREGCCPSCGRGGRGRASRCCRSRCMAGRGRRGGGGFGPISASSPRPSQPRAIPARRRWARCAGRGWRRYPGGRRWRWGGSGLRRPGGSGGGRRGWRPLGPWVGPRIGPQGDVAYPQHCLSEVSRLREARWTSPQRRAITLSGPTVHGAKFPGAAPAEGGRRIVASRGLPGSGGGLECARFCSAPRVSLLPR